MQQRNGSGSILNSLDDILRQQQNMLDHIQKGTDADSRTTKALPDNSKESGPPTQTVGLKPFKPFDIDAFNRSFFQKEPPLEFQTENPEPSPPEFQEAFASAMAKKKAQSGFINSAPLFEKRENKPPKTTITDQQLRALSRKHLLMMIRDLEKELEQVKEENEHLLQAYQAGLEQKSQI